MPDMVHVFQINVSIWRKEAFDLVLWSQAARKGDKNYILQLVCQDKSAEIM